jgi:hypothetical protein
MAIATELRQALDESRDELVRVMASYKVVPVESEAEQETATGLLGGGGETHDFNLEQWGDIDTKLADRQTRKLIVEKLGVDTAEDCQAVQDEIENHEDWGAQT